VTNTRSPQTIGEDHPRPGISVTHATLSVEEKLRGRFAASATPDAPAPRNCGQCARGDCACAASDTTAAHTITTLLPMRIFRIRSMVAAHVKKYKALYMNGRLCGSGRIRTTAASRLVAYAI